MNRSLRLGSAGMCLTVIIAEQQRDMNNGETIMQKTTIFKALIAAAALTGTVSAVAADAQPRPYVRQEMRDDRIENRIDNLRDRITEGRRFHALSAREASRLNARLNGIRSLERQFERSRGLDARETATLNMRLDQLSADIRYQGHDGNRR